MLNNLRLVVPVRSICLPKVTPPPPLASAVGVSARSVQRWQRDLHSPPQKGPAKPMGRPPRLCSKQVGKLEKELARGAYAHGYAEATGP